MNITRVAHPGRLPDPHTLAQSVGGRASATSCQKEGHRWLLPTSAL
jgi:hypothetical protein